IFNLTIEAIFDRWGHLVIELQVDAILCKIDDFCLAVEEKGAPLPMCWGFLDGTVRKISRPSRQQRLYYNGWKRVHALKYRAVDSTDGIIRQLWGPMLGRRHDVALLGESQLLQSMMDSFHDAAGEPYYIYGDPAYQISPWLMAPYKRVLTPEQQDFNSGMSRVRVWPGGCPVSIRRLREKAAMVNEGPLVHRGDRYAVAGMLTNCHCCFYPNSTAQFFDVTPPDVQTYLEGQA
ncbi:unnamed protein product, partial [Pylaiella littoralis]